MICCFRLCGYEPFYSGENEAEMYKKILKADYKFDPPFWNNISENAKVFPIRWSIQYQSLPSCWSSNGCTEITVQFLVGS